MSSRCLADSFKWRLIGLLWLLAVPAFAPGPAVAGPDAPTVLAVRIDAALSPAQADLLDAAIDRAKALPADLLLIELDTPGGGIETMRRMVASLLNAPLPTAVWVSPSGARAASAGVFLVAAARTAAMSPETTIGSASPVLAGGGGLEATMERKVKNDLESLLRGLCASRGRNAGWYVRSVSEAASLNAAEAVAERVVDMIAVSRDDLMRQIGRRGLPFAGELRRFDGGRAVFVDHEPGFRHKALAWLLDPQIAYILLLIGMAGLFFELTSPGAVLPGVVGGLCGILALYALSVLPTNTAGVLLLLFGAGLFLLEAHVTSYGLLGLAGVAALFYGSLLLFRFDGGPGLPLSLIAPTVGGVSLLLFGAGWLLARAQRLAPRSGVAALVGRTAVVRRWSGRSGRVFVAGESWRAVAEPGAFADASPAVGQEVRVRAVAEMTLVVGPADAGPAATL